MGSLSTGGGTSAVAASAHAGCERFRLTDPLLTRVSRRALAARLGHPDVAAGVPQARWMRALTFEGLVHSPDFVSELLTKALGQLREPRPDGVRRAACAVCVDTTAHELEDAHLCAVRDNQATMLVELAVPFVGLDPDVDATPVKPDFAIVCPRWDADSVAESIGEGTSGARPAGSWLILGDAKDYERVRSRIDDVRLLKGFLQVALGAESAQAWERLPAGMAVHRHSVLAVPRNAFLQPEAVVEQLDDHRAEVRARASERLEKLAELGPGAPAEGDLVGFVAGQAAAFEPMSCVTCNLFDYCRAQLRTSPDPEALLVEIGIEPASRPCLRSLVAGNSAAGAEVTGAEVTGTEVAGTPVTGTVPAQTLAQVTATLTGRAQRTPRRRTDPAGLPGTVNVVLAKSDAATLGVHGLGIQAVAPDGPGAWTYQDFLTPQSPQTRQTVMTALGDAFDRLQAAGVGPLHLVVPDTATADLLVDMADSLAGVELSRLRWQRDLDAGREPLTFDGEPATPPDPLTEHARLAVSFLLEEDRARAMTLRHPVVDLRAVLGRHVVAGGPAVDSGRLDYLLEWAEATTPLRHREVSDDVAARERTPGARLSNTDSDRLHAALRGRPDPASQPDPAEYARLVRQALTYKTDVVDRTLAVLARLPVSRLRDAHRALEADAQQVWLRRYRLRASDLVRFSRTSQLWRNVQVEMLDADTLCARQLSILTDPRLAHDQAQTAGVREVALAEVVGVGPVRLRVRSRRIAAGSTIVLLHVNGTACAEDPATTVKIQQGSIKLGLLSLGPLTASDENGKNGRNGGTGEDGVLEWAPAQAADLKVGDTLIVADAGWFTTFRSGHEIAVKRPSLDTRAAPKPTCGPDSYAADPETHQWCCRPHEVAEAEYSDLLAERRANGELNPQAWPPLIDTDRFDTPGPGTAPDGDAGLAAAGTAAVPDDLTLDDLE